jgi:hypothetical protein
MNFSRIRLLIALALVALGSTPRISCAALCQTLTIPLTLSPATGFSRFAATITAIGFPLLPTPSRCSATVTAIATEWMIRGERLLASFEQAKTAADPVMDALIRRGFWRMLWWAQGRSQLPNGQASPGKRQLPGEASLLNGDHSLNAQSTTSEYPRQKPPSSFRGTARSSRQKWCAQSRHQHHSATLHDKAVKEPVCER